MPTVRPQIFETNDATTTITPPPTAQAGDLLLAFLSYESTLFGATLTGGTPEWELLTSKVTTITNAGTTQGAVSSGIWWKPAGTGETSWTLTEEGAAPSNYMAAAVVAVTDARLDAPLFTASGDQTNATTPFTAVTSPAQLVTAAGDLELRWVGADNYNTSALRAWTEPSPTTEVADLSSTFVAAQLTRQALTTTSTPARTHTLTSGSVYAAHGFTVRIRPPVVARSVLVPTGAAHRAASW
jgi:hypothetical protein